MQWLLHGSLTPAAAEALVRHEHKVHPLAELALAAEATLDEFLEAVDARQWDVITNDSAFVHALFDGGHSFKRSIVFLQLAGGDVEQDDAIDRLFDRYRRLNPRHLYTVTESRVKTRQLPRG